MAINIQLLKLARNAAATVNKTTDNPEYKALLSATDFVLNELMLQESPQFYLDYLAKGKTLLTEGRQLAIEKGSKAAEPIALRGDIDAEMHIGIINTEIERLHQCLLAVVTVLDEGRSTEEKSYLIRLSEWEATIYNHSLEQARYSLEGKVTPITAITLQVYLIDKFPAWKDLKVTKFMALDGGFSKKTILFETHDAMNGAQSMVIRAEQPVDMLGYEGSDVTQEINMIYLMGKAGLPIAEPQWLETDRSLLGTRFIVSKKALGKSYGGALGTSEEMPLELVQSMLGTFIKMHKIKIDPNDPLAQKSHLKEWLPLSGSMHDTIHYYVTVFMPRLMKKCDIPPSPQLLRALKWLENNIPETDETPTIIHIDFSFNNLIIDGKNITAVLDWESSRLGDPAEDIIWTQLNLGAYISMPEFLKLYQERTGRKISDFRLAYARVSKCAVNAITCFSAMRLLDKDDAAHINMSVLAYKYMALFGSQFNSLIAEAEKVRGK